MLAVKLNIHQFEYDIHSLVKAFYPETDVKVFVEGEKDLVSEGDYPNLIVELYENKISLQATFTEGEPLVMDATTKTSINLSAPILLILSTHDLVKTNDSGCKSIDALRISEKVLQALI